MRRTEIAEGIERILVALRDSKFEKVLRAFFDRSERSDKSGFDDLFEALHKYHTHSMRFSESDRKIVTILQLQMLDDPQWWASLVAPSAGSIHDAFFAVQFAETHLPKLLYLLQQEDQERLPPEAAAGSGQERLLTILLLEEVGQRSSPARLILALEGISLLYEAIAAMNDLPDNGLAVAGCDSGSDKSFDFLGLAKAIDGVREVLLSVWDRVVFFREKKLEARIELVAKALPVVEKIDELERNGSIA